MDNAPIFFYCAPPGLPNTSTTVYQHAIVCLAEGLKALRVPFYSDRNFWRIGIETNDYLFNHDPNITPDDCAAVVLNTAWFTSGQSMPKGLFQAQRSFLTVYFETEADAKHAWQSEFRPFDFVFRCHYNRRFKYPENFRPWAFGLSNRILAELNHLPAYAERKQILLVNFRLGHPIRRRVQQKFLPLIETVLPVDTAVEGTQEAPSDPYAYLQWTQTDRRHYPSYYQRLLESAACACFGGLLINRWPPDAFGPSTPLDKLINKVLTLTNSQPRRLMNWESWRFWEAMAAGSVVFHVDLEKYGANLPVMPENWHHYIGIDLDNMQATIDRITDNPEILDYISQEGRKWALEHYSPIPTALRFLSTLGLDSPKLASQN